MLLTFVVQILDKLFDRTKLGFPIRSSGMSDLGNSNSFQFGVHVINTIFNKKRSRLVKRFFNTRIRHDEELSKRNDCACMSTCVQCFILLVLDSITCLGNSLHIQPIRLFSSAKKTCENVENMCTCAHMLTRLFSSVANS